MNTVYFEEKIIPAHYITNCSECPNFNENAAPYGDGHTCDIKYGTNNLVSRNGIPDECPLLEELTNGKDNHGTI